MEFYLRALNFTVVQTVPLISSPLFRDSVKVPLFLYDLNTLFFFQNGNYYVRYKQFYTSSGFSCETNNEHVKSTVGPRRSHVRRQRGAHVELCKRQRMARQFRQRL